MADGCHFKSQKWPYLGNGFTDRHEIWSSDVSLAMRPFVKYFDHFLTLVQILKHSR